MIILKLIEGKARLFWGVFRDTENMLLFSGSQEEVKRFCEDAIKGLEQNKANSHIIVQFVDNIIDELESFNPMNKDAQQWSNIRMARTHFNRIKQRLGTSVS